VELQGEASSRQGAETAGPIQLCPTSSSWKHAPGWGGKAGRQKHEETEIVKAYLFCLADTTKRDGEHSQE